MKKLKILFLFLFLFIGIFFYSNSFAVWVQEDLEVAGTTTIKNKIEYLKNVETNGVIDSARIANNLFELKKLYKNGDIPASLKNDYLQAIMNNLYWIDVGGELKRSYIGYKIVDGVETLSLNKDFLIEIQKDLSGNYKDTGRTDVEAEEIANKIIDYFQDFIYPTPDITYGFYPKAVIANHLSFISVGNKSGYALNTVFEDVCKKEQSKTLCIETPKGGLLGIGFRDSITGNAYNQDEYRELVSNYEIDGKVQLPSALKARLENICPITNDHTVSRFIENETLDECGLIAHDFDCDGHKEWIDVNHTLKTTNVYSANVIGSGDGAIIKVQLILFLNKKEIKKFYKNQGGCYSHVLATNWDDNTSKKIIYSDFNGVDSDSAFTLSSDTINGKTIVNSTLKSKEITSEQYNFFKTNEIYNEGIENNWTIDFEKKDVKPITEKKDILGVITLSNSDLANSKLKIYANQKEFGFEKMDGSAKITFDSKKNGISNIKFTHYTITNKNGLISWFINGKPYFSYDSNSDTLKVEDGVDYYTKNGSISKSDFELTKYMYFSNHYITGEDNYLVYQNFYISHPHSGKVYLYKLNQTNDVTNFYLGQIIDNLGFNYDFYDKGTSTDDICKSMAEKNANFFDDNMHNDGGNYIGFNPGNGCDFIGKKIYFYSDLDGKLSYLKKINITGIYDLTDEVFKFTQTEDNILQGTDYGVLLNGLLKNCNITQVLNNELDSCSELKPIDLDNDNWNEWVYSKDGNLEIFNNVVTTNVIGDYVPSLLTMFKNSGDNYCTMLDEDISYYKKRSEEDYCKPESEVDDDITSNGGTKEDCTVTSALVTNGINDYQFIYGIDGNDKNDKKYTRTQILQNSPILCD